MDESQIIQSADLQKPLTSGADTSVRRLTSTSKFTPCDKMAVITENTRGF